MYRVEWIDDEGNLKIKRGFKKVRTGASVD